MIYKTGHRSHIKGKGINRFLKTMNYFDHYNKIFQDVIKSNAIIRHDTASQSKG